MSLSNVIIDSKFRILKSASSRLDREFFPILVEPMVLHTICPFSRTLDSMPGIPPKPASPPSPDAGQAGLAQTIVDAIPAHIAVLDRRGVILEVNSAWRRFALENASTSGVMPTGSDVGANYLDICEAARGLASEGAEDAAAGIRAVMAGQCAEFRLEYPCHSPDVQRWFLMWVTPLPRPESNVVVVHVDITARKLAEMSARENALRLELALEASGDGLWDWDLGTGRAFLSPSYYTMTGYRPPDVSANLDFFRALVHPEDWPQVETTMQAHLRGETPESRIEYRMLTRGGETRWTLGRGRVTERDGAGHPLRMMGLISDITHEKKLENQLRASEARYKAVLEDQTEVIARYRSDGTVLYVNEVFCRLFGIPADEVVGQRWQPHAHADDLPMIEACLAQLSPANPVVTIENRVFVAGGQIRWMQFVNRGFFDEGGTLLELQAVGRDISKRKHLEQERESLLEENTRLGRELIAVQERERVALARELHDELSQDLVAIRAHAAAIRRATRPSLEDSRANARAIETCASRIYAVSHRIMEGLRPQVLDSAGLPDALSALLAEWSAAHPDVHVSFRCPWGDGPIHDAVRTQLFRIVQECLANVARHSRARRVRLFMGGRSSGGLEWLRLVVRDDGVGMETGSAPGYGLIIMRERAHSLGGRFDCHCVPGQGVRIAVEVPRSSPD